MAIEKDFPNIKPTSGIYSPGNYPQVEFEAQNGVKTVIRYGKNRTGATLSLGFNNIEDQKAAEILDHYEEVNSVWNYVTFGNDDALSGVGFVQGTQRSQFLSNYMKEGGNKTKRAKDGSSTESSGLKWRYDGPPMVTSVYPGRSNVECKFVACLDSP